MEFNFEYIDLKPYKGYNVQKAWELIYTKTHYGEYGYKRHGKPRYIVADEEGYIGEEYYSLSEAHRFIDSII